MLVQLKSLIVHVCAVVKVMMSWFDCAQRLPQHLRLHMHARISIAWVTSALGHAISLSYCVCSRLCAHICLTKVMSRFEGTKRLPQRLQLEMHARINLAWVASALGPVTSLSCCICSYFCARICVAKVLSICKDAQRLPQCSWLEMHAV